MSTALSPVTELEVSLMLLNAPVSCTTGTTGSRFSSTTIAWTERAQARPITSLGVAISLSRSAAARPRFRRNETRSSSGVSTTIACRSPNRSASRPEVSTSMVPAWPISIRPDLLPRRLQQPSHLEPAEPELVGDLDLGPAVDVVPARDGRGQHQLGGSLDGAAGLTPRLLI